MTTRSHPTSAPSRGRKRPPTRVAGDSALRLAIGRDGVGLELSSPVGLECVRLVELSAAFRGIRFPVDVSGGVSKFRHRRGHLQRVALELDAPEVEKWAAPRLRGVVGTGSPSVWIQVGPGRATFCVSEEHKADAQSRVPAPAVAFDVHLLVDEDIVLVVSNARGVGLSAPPTALAIAVMRALLASVADRSGATFSAHRPAAALARAVLPNLGARSPAANGVRWAVAAAQGTTWILLAARDAIPAEASEDALRAREAAEILVAADDLMMTGQLDEARAALLGAIERAPRHEEIVRRIVEIDARTPGREEAALAMLSEMPISGRDGSFAIVRGELLSRSGRINEAMAAFERAAETERVPALGSRSYESCASLSLDPEHAARWLDRALSLSPRSTSARWSRARARLAMGRIDDALGDVEHLEALAEGSAGKHSVWMHAGKAWQVAGLHVQSARIFERALVHLPDEPKAIAGLGAALVAGGSVARGVSLLARAHSLAATRGEAGADILLQLAVAFAERLDDLPTAISHASCVPSNALQGPLARGLEGRWRAALGDVVGARLSFARLQDWANTAAPSGDVPVSSIVQLLLEAATWELEQHHDPMAAQRHVLAALRWAPQDATVRARARDVGQLVAARLSPERDTALASPPRVGSLSSPVATVAQPAPLDARVRSWPSLSADEAGQTLRADDLMRRLQANPNDDEAADELAALLEILDRGHELLALLSGRMEDAPPEKRQRMVPQVTSVLRRMASAAERQGRIDEAGLYRDTATALESS